MISEPTCVCATGGVRAPVRPANAHGLLGSILDHGALCELHLTLRPLPGETWSAACRRLRDALADHAATPAAMMVLGDCRQQVEAVTALRRLFGAVNWPVTWAEGADLGGRPWAGMQVWAVRGAPVEPIEVAGRVLGSQYRDAHARRVLLGGLGPGRTTGSSPEQARRTFEQLEAVLAQVGLRMAHVARTWFFLDNILAWYGEFNRVRTDFFRARGVFGGVVPASTGVGASNPDGAAVTAAALALEACGTSAGVAEIPSPAQCPATSYGSSFSRAVEIRAGRCRHVIVSGTASIAPDGRSAHPGQLLGQIELTFAVVGDILKSRGLEFADTTRATAYFKTAEGAEIFGDWLARQGWQGLPVVSAVATVCREELLFELELDAARAD